MARVRTNIEIEDDFVRAIMDRYGVHTKTDAVDLALPHLAGQPRKRSCCEAPTRSATSAPAAPGDPRRHLGVDRVQPLLRPYCPAAF
jgi:Arc/MetJ family transcription regulator